MSDEWVLEQCKATLLQLPIVSSLLLRHKTFNFSSLPKDIKLLILSFCGLDDFSCMFLVCKEWNSFQDHIALWKPHILHHLISLRSSPLWCLRYENLLRHQMDDRSSRMRFAWLFQNSANVVIFQDGNENDHHDVFRIQLAFKRQFFWWFSKSGSEITNYGLWDKEKDHESVMHYCKKDSLWIKLCQPMSHRGKFLSDCKGTVIYRREEGIFEGDSLNRLPHGKGIWTFNDGTYFKGEKVAFCGFPHGKGLNEKGEEIEYIAGYLKDDLDEAYLRRSKKKQKR